MHLLQPLTINTLKLKNRLVMAPMCMYSADEEGLVQPFHQMHYDTRAHGGVGLIIQEATAIEPCGRITNHDLGIWDDKHFLGLKKIVNGVHQYGCKMAIQLAHAGRKSKVRGPIYSSNNVPFNDHYQIPQKLTIEKIADIKGSFKQAVIRAMKVGYDAIEIHAAHGYLINQFLSPLVNERDDLYGGCLANRVRFLKEILTEIRTIYQGPLWIRVSAEEYDKKGHHIKETLQVLDHLKDLIDGVNVSSGGVIPIKPNEYPGYQLDYAKQIKAKGLITFGGGQLTKLEQIEQALIDKQADLIYLGRPLLLNPYFLIEQLKDKKSELKPVQYERG